jgi:hypothetical protein
MHRAAAPPLAQSGKAGPPPPLFSLFGALLFSWRVHTTHLLCRSLATGPRCWCARARKKKSDSQPKANHGPDATGRTQNVSTDAQLSIIRGRGAVCGYAHLPPSRSDGYLSLGDAREKYGTGRPLHALMYDTPSCHRSHGIPIPSACPPLSTYSDASRAASPFDTECRASHRCHDLNQRSRSQ